MADVDAVQSFALSCCHHRRPVRPDFAGALPIGHPTATSGGAPNIKMVSRFAGWWRRQHASTSEVTIGGPRFDTDFDLVGGEDTHFMLLRWLAANQRLVWSASAVATEIVPDQRLTLDYARDRAYFSSVAYQHAIQKVRGRRRTFDTLRVVRRWGISMLFRLYATPRRRFRWMRAPRSAPLPPGNLGSNAGKGVDRWANYQIDV